MRRLELLIVLVLLQEVIFSLIIHLVKTPAPSRYEIPSTLNKTSKTFGEPRSKFDKVFLKTGCSFSTCAPGPGAYETSYITGFRPFKYSMRPRTKCWDDRASIPGPKYDPLSCTNSVGKYFVDKLKGSCATKFGPEKRFLCISIIPTNDRFKVARSRQI